MNMLQLALAGCLLLSACGRRPTVPPVILKFDDLREEDGTVPDAWRSLFAELDARGIPATLGLIGSSLEDGSEEYVAWIRAQHHHGHEVWNHGYCHCKPPGPDGEQLLEFAGTPATYQREQLARSQELARQRLGFSLRSFGAPFNATDSLTASVLANLPEIRVWLYPPPGALTDKIVLPAIRGLNLEYPTHQPDFEKFRAAYQEHPNAAVIVLQGHPRSWVADPARLSEFYRILDFLVARGTRFTTPSAYSLAQTSTP